MRSAWQWGFHKLRKARSSNCLGSSSSTWHLPKLRLRKARSPLRSTRPRSSYPLLRSILRLVREVRTPTQQPPGFGRRCPRSKASIAHSSLLSPQLRLRPHQRPYQRLHRRPQLHLRQRLQQHLRLRTLQHLQQQQLRR